MDSSLKYYLILVGLMIFVVACDRVTGEPQQAAFYASAEVPQVRQIELQPGEPLPPEPVWPAYEDPEEAVASGGELYAWFNCGGCHFAGGGGIGPPLMDEAWIYGSQSQNIYQTIVQGRPNGMPSFGGKIPREQLWQIVAYVRSLSGLPLLPENVTETDSENVPSAERAADAVDEEP